VKIIITLMLIVIPMFFCRGANEDYFDRIVDAIYRAEGGAKAQYLYGIRSVKYKDAEEARRICYNTVRNNWGRWEKSGQQVEYLVFLANRYAPIGAENDPKGLNNNWLRNVRFYLNK